MSAICWCGWPSSEAHGHFDWQPYSTRVGGPAAVETCHHSRLTPGCAPCWEAYATALVKLLDDPVATVLAVACPIHASSGVPCLSDGFVCLARIRLAINGGK